ncbi:hypothetical protein BDN72DRAFT_852953 [Pluteus cervinus]|uniref:Uncharacterized protein n=1 Tax=Pluteus cervinus TaxID=181527 RepID=A0ACD3BCT2_9AGAR|nr:hypothetical protein BDN72DRAFT_852953 [Pluteus cervinus]
MGWFNNDSDQATSHDSYHKNTASVSHELLAGAAAFEAAKAYENHVASQGKPDSHAKAKEILAGFAGAFIDREVETSGRDWFDKEKAKREAKQAAQSHFDEVVTVEKFEEY